MTHIVKNFAPPALPLPGVNYSAQQQSQFNNVLRLYFNQLDNLLNPLLTELNVNNYAAITTVTGNYTITDADSTVLCDATSGSMTITLPSAAQSPSRFFNIKKIDATNNTVSITPAGAETIDGDTSKTIGLQWVNVVVHSDGTNWYIL